MAQWVPKTAWRNHNLHHVYGTAAVGLHLAPASKRAAEVVPRPPGATNTLRQLYRSGVAFLDLRDPTDATRYPVPKAVPIHLHDLVSGAAREILPNDKNAATIVVLAGSAQRRVHGAAALQRLGYPNVLQASFEDVKAFAAES